MKILTLFCAFLGVALAKHLEPRIYGGENTTIEARPYMAALLVGRVVDNGDKLNFACSSSIISTKFLLTAGHCQPRDPHLMYARVGSSYYAEGGQLLKVATFQRHDVDPIDKDSYAYDVAVVGLELELELGPTVAVIPLTEYKEPDDESLVIISGWGKTASTDNLSPILKEVQLPIMPFYVCKGIFKEQLTNTNICVGGTLYGDIVCLGDSGNPAIQDGVQYAVAVGGTDDWCGLELMPQPLTRVSSVRDWIRKLTGV